MYVEDQKMKQVNSIMRELNGLTDEIYEGLADGDYGAVNMAISAMTTMLLELSKFVGDE
jgi:hypothetical protein